MGNRLEYFNLYVTIEQTVLVFYIVFAIFCAFLIIKGIMRKRSRGELAIFWVLKIVFDFFLYFLDYRLLPTDDDEDDDVEMPKIHPY
jgi:hypothetical protein